MSVPRTLVCGIAGAFVIATALRAQEPAHRVGPGSKVDAQEFVSLFDGSGLEGWKTEHRTAERRAGILHVNKGNGWVRTERTYADFVLKLDVRVTEDAVAGIFVRAWLETGVKAGDSSCGNAMAHESPNNAKSVNEAITIEFKNRDSFKL